MDERLIYDVGTNTGQDARHYLDEGFRVVAVEANPRLCQGLRKRFAAELASGRLVLVEAAVAPEAGEVEFVTFRGGRRFRRKDECGALDNHYARRNIAEHKFRAKRIRVQARTFESILDEFGLPYYLKLDIEGAEPTCLDALRSFTGRPRYLSLEIDYLEPEAGLRAFEQLVDLGYRSFKIVRQAGHGEGFEWGSSGPFGDATAGAWIGAETMRDELRRTITTLDWHDLHARHE